MKKTSTFLFFIVLTFGLKAQLNMIEFATSKEDANWTSFGNNPDSPADLRIVENPDKTGINASDSVLQYTINATGETWAGASIIPSKAITFTEEYHILKMMVNKSVIDNCELKVEQSTDGGENTSVKVANTLTDQWEELTFDFSACIGHTYEKLVIFPEEPETRTEGSVSYLDNITGTQPGDIPANLFRFEYKADLVNWHAFDNGAHTDDAMSIVLNPDNSEINGSDSCMLFNVEPDAATWVGAYIADLDAAIEITEEFHTLTMMVYKDVISPCGFQVNLDGEDKFEIKVPNTVTNQWELISFDFSDAIGKSFNRLVFFPDFPETRTAGSTCYLDNFSLVESALPTGVKQPSNAAIRIFPNPVSEVMYVQHPDMRAITITNILGSTVKTFKFQNTNFKSIELNDLKTGVYFITVKSTSGIYTLKFIKN